MPEILGLGMIRAGNVRQDTVPLLFDQRLTKYGDRVALRKKALGRWHEISWRDYGQRVREVASGLVALGLRRGECVSIVAENRPE